MEGFDSDLVVKSDIGLPIEYACNYINFDFLLETWGWRDSTQILHSKVRFNITDRICMQSY